MNAEETVLSVAQNSDLPAKPLPESAEPKSLSIPRPLTLIRLINQWQPMGIRVTVNIPFKTDDQTLFFLVRNGPFIPRYNKMAFNSLGQNVSMYAFNNLRNVFTVPRSGGQYARQYFCGYPQDYGIHVQYYDYPPVISTVAQAFRKWRGDMQYRFRVIAGFVTQAYMFVAPLKNSFMPVGVYDEYSSTPIPTRLDLSYRELMTNAYVMTDASMFRHSEVTVPYEYPVPWYDQFQWISNRLVPGLDMIVEPFGDNFIVVGCRGDIDATEAKTMTFELEYRCAEGFQFADPGLPPCDIATPIAPTKHWGSASSWELVKTMPSPDWASDGLNKIVSTKPSQSGGPPVTIPLGDPSKLTPALNPSDYIQPPAGTIDPLPSFEAIRPTSRTTTSSTQAPTIIEEEQSQGLDIADGMETLKVQPSAAQLRGLYTECVLSPSGAHTYCRTDDQRSWDTFPGDQRHRAGSTRDVNAQHAKSHVIHKREREFT